MTSKVFQKLLLKIRKYNAQADFELIKKAFEFAAYAHQGQKRISGEDFINHPLAVADILANWKLDSVSIAAGLLHDVVEDTEVKKEEIEKIFGKEIANLVDGVTKVDKTKFFGSKEDEFAESLRKMILIMAKDMRVPVIKLADRYHNLQTLYPLSKEKQQRIAQETIDIYAPLAERLSMEKMRGELEDLAFPYIYPQEYQWVLAYSRPYFEKAGRHIKKIKQRLLEALAEEGIKAKIDDRRKHLYSLYLKLCRPEVDKNINKIYDLITLRIILNTVEECYAALRIVHKICKPFPLLGIRDWIARPKPNGYRSIHTNIFVSDGQIAEIQIRTWEMHKQAENGIIAYWHYSQQKTPRLTRGQRNVSFFAPPAELSWVKELVKWQKEITDSKEFIKYLKSDFLKSRIFVFSSQGDVYDLPEGATPIDFAYALHSQLGNEAVGARVNGTMVRLNHSLKNGDVVEIIRKKGASPSKNWLNFVVTYLAKRRIEEYFKKVGK